MIHQPRGWRITSGFPRPVCKASAMSISLLVTIGLTVLFAAITAGLFASNRRLRTLLIGLGITLLPFGLYFLQITDLAVNGIKSLIDWAQRTYFDSLMTLGAGLLGGGLVLAIIGALIPRRIQLGGGAPEHKQQRPAVQGRPGPAGAPVQQRPAAGAKDKSADDEVEEILRRRGIM